MTRKGKKCFCLPVDGTQTNVSEPKVISRSFLQQQRRRPATGPAKTENLIWLPADCLSSLLPKPGLFFSVSESQLVVQTNSITDAWWSCVLPSALTGQRRQMVLRAGGGPLWSLDGSDRRVTGLSAWLHSYKTAQMLAFSSLNHLLYSSNGRPSKSRKIGLIV